MNTVYLIASGVDEKQYKIGYTKRPVEERIKEFKTGNSNDLEIISIFESKWAVKIESYLHRLFKSKRIKGEWFNLSNDDIKSFHECCEKTHNNIELLATKNSYIIDRGGL